MARPQVNDGGDILQIWSVAANMLNPYAATFDFSRMPMHYSARRN
jgi:hypothetical protein